jgi:hypothetical protein
MSAEKEARETEFFIMRTAQLPNQQGIQVNCNVFKGEAPAEAYKRLLRCEDFIDKVRKKHQLVFMEEQMKQLENVMTQEVDHYEGLKKERQGGKKMNDNMLKRLGDLPAQIGVHKHQMVQMREDYERVKSELKDFV